jgi:hypothetical protein
MEQLLADMKSSLFGLRVGAQVFETLSIQPLGEAMASVVDSKKSLFELVAKANGTQNDSNYFFLFQKANLTVYLLKCVSQS